MNPKMNVSHRSAAKSLWVILFRFEGSIWCSVLPYCILNCGIMALIEFLAMNHFRIAFSASGHGLMTLIISYLIVAKVNLSYGRYMKARHAIGHALSSLRELNQLTMAYINQNEESDRNWRRESTTKIIDLVDCTIRVIKNETQAIYLARNENPEATNHDDPMMHVQALQLHLYRGSGMLQLELMERMKFLDMLNDFTSSYRTLLELASTPMPFPLVQMARTFLFLWTFTIPFVLRGVVDEAVVAMIFVFFLTYGFVGLELVAMKLMFPFGDGKSDLNVNGMREATVRGLERDLRLFGEDMSSVGDRRLEFSQQKPRPPTVSSHYPSTNDNLNQGDDTPQTDHMYTSLH